MDDVLVLAAVGVVAYLVWKKYKKPCCASCAGASVPAPATKTDAYAPAQPIGLNGDFVLATYGGELERTQVQQTECGL